jgi:hypothetical protein
MVNAMTAAARKKPTEDSAPPDDPRAALRAAKDSAWREISALASHQDSIKRAESLVENTQVELVAAARAIEQAERAYSQAAAKAISQNETVGSPAATLKAREHQAELNVQSELATSALLDLRQETARKELAAAVARNAVVVERNVLLVPIAAAVLTRIKARRIAQLKDRVLLSLLISDDGAPEFPRDASSFFAAREAEVSRRQVFGAVRAEAAADAADLATVPPTHDITEAEMVMGYHARWVAQLAALLENPDAELPENA